MMNPLRTMNNPQCHGNVPSNYIYLYLCVLQGVEGKESSIDIVIFPLGTMNVCMKTLPCA